MPSLVRGHGAYRRRRYDLRLCRSEACIICGQAILRAVTECNDRERKNHAARRALSLIHCKKRGVIMPLTRRYYTPSLITLSH